MLHRFKGEEVVEVVMCMGVDIWNDVLMSPSLAHIALECLDAFYQSSSLGFTTSR